MGDPWTPRRNSTVWCSEGFQGRGYYTDRTRLKFYQKHLSKWKCSLWFHRFLTFCKESFVLKWFKKTSLDYKIIFPNWISKMMWLFVQDYLTIKKNKPLPNHNICLVPSRSLGPKLIPNDAERPGPLMNNFQNQFPLST